MSGFLFCDLKSCMMVREYMLLKVCRQSGDDFVIAIWHRVRQIVFTLITFLRMNGAHLCLGRYRAENQAFSTEMKHENVFA